MFYYIVDILIGIYITTQISANTTTKMFILVYYKNYCEYSKKILQKCVSIETDHRLK